MPLLDHLIELRQRLLWAVLALFGCFLVAFFFAEQIYLFLQQPLHDVLIENTPLDETRRRMIFTGLAEVFTWVFELRQSAVRRFALAAGAIGKSAAAS